MRDAGLLDSAQRHAQVLGLDHDAHALRRELALKPAGDLGREALLNLQAARVQLDDPAELGQPQDPVPREVAEMGDAVEGKHVVLAERVEGDVASDHELVVVARRSGRSSG